MKNLLHLVFILPVLLSCKAEEKTESLHKMPPPITVATTTSQVSFTNKDEWPRIEPTIDLFFPVEQSSYLVEFTSFVKNNENNIYTRISPVDSLNCLKDEQCDVSNIVYLVWTSYEEPVGCRGDCVTSRICALVDNAQTLLYSAAWEPESMIPKNVPDTCLTGGNGGDTLYDCTENTAGQNHELAHSSIFQSLYEETSSGVNRCF